MFIARFVIAKLMAEIYELKVDPLDLGNQHRDSEKSTSDVPVVKGRGLHVKLRHCIHYTGCFRIYVQDFRM